MDVTIVHQLEPEHVRQLSRFYTEQLDNPRTEAEVKQMLSRTDLVVGLLAADRNQLLGFARVITDYTFKAFILDVVIDEAHRGMGLGRMLMEAIHTHPDLRTVKSLQLYCYPDVIEFYEAVGWHVLADGHVIMRYTPT